MIRRTFRFRAGGATPEKTMEGRLRFVDSTIPAADGWTFAGADTPDIGGSAPGYVLVGVLGWSDIPRGGVSCPTKVLLTLSSGPISVSGDPQSSPSRGNDISIAQDGPRALVVVSQDPRMRGHIIKRI